MQIGAVTVEGGDLPREGRINVDHQVTAQAEFAQRDVVQPFRQCLHPLRFPVLRQGVLQPGDGDIVQHQRFSAAQPVAGGAHHPAFPARGELAQGNPLRGEFRIQDRVEQVQRAVDKLTGIHRQATVLALPVALAQGQVAQAQIEIRYRPVRPLQAGVRHVETANLQRRQRGDGSKKVGQRFIALQADIVQAHIVHLPAAVGVATRGAGEGTSCHIRTDSGQHHLFVGQLPLDQHVAGRYAVQRQRPGADLDVCFFTQHVTCFRVPRAHTPGHLLGAEIPGGIGAVKGHVIQQQAIGLEGKRRRLGRKIQRAVKQGNGIHMQRIGELAAAHADIHHFCHQGRRLAIAPEGDVFQHQVGGGREAVIHQVKIEFVVGVYRDPATDLRRSPAGLNKDIEREDRDKQNGQNTDEKLSNKFHGLPSRKTHIKELCTIYAHCSRREWWNSGLRQQLPAAVKRISSFLAGRSGSGR